MDVKETIFGNDEENEETAKEYITDQAQQIEEHLDNVKLDIQTNLLEILDTLKSQGCPEVVDESYVREAMEKFDMAVLYLETLIKEIKEH